MDDADRKELSATEVAEAARKEWLDMYGSFLYCPQRDTLCVYMDGMWMTGCELPVCIRDTESWQKQQAIIEANREKNAAEHRREHAEKKKEPPAPIRDQRNLIKSHTSRQMEEIRRLEEASAEAFRQNKPNLGHTLFNRAGIRRQELKAWQKKNTRGGN